MPLSSKVEYEEEVEIIQKVKNKWLDGVHACDWDSKRMQEGGMKEPM